MINYNIDPFLGLSNWLYDPTLILHPKHWDLGYKSLMRRKASDRKQSSTKEHQVEEYTDNIRGHSNIRGIPVPAET